MNIRQNNNIFGRMTRIVILLCVTSVLAGCPSNTSKRPPRTSTAAIGGFAGNESFLFDCYQSGTTQAERDQSIAQQVALNLNPNACFRIGCPDTEACVNDINLYPFTFCPTVTPSFGVPSCPLPSQWIKYVNCLFIGGLQADVNGCAANGNLVSACLNSAGISETQFVICTGIGSVS